MKKILISTVMAVSVLFLANCSKTDNEAVTSPSAPAFSSKNISGAMSPTGVTATGLMYARRNSSTVPIESDSALLVLSFPTTMKNSATVVLKRVADNSELPVTTTWDIGSNYSTLKIQPANNLQINKRYWIKVVASSIIDSKGNVWDFDGDGVGGEIVDDDYVFYFNTTDGSGGAGVLTDVERYVVDEWRPVISGSLFCWVNTVGQTPILNTYLNSSFYLRLTDRLLRVDRTAQDTVGPFLGTIDDSKIWLIDGETRSKIPSSVAKGNDPDATYGIAGSTVRIQPTDRLAPNKTYFVMVQKNLILDEAKNKMDNDDGPGGDTLMFRITTSDSVGDGTVAGADVVGPSIASYSSKRISFNELVDESTVNSSTIWYRDGSSVQRPLQLTMSVEYTGTGKPFTVVTVTPLSGYSSGTLSINLRKIRDLTGNFGSGISTYTL